MSDQKPFNPNEHLMQIKSRNGNNDYLPVQWRIVWFREKFPNGTIDTEELEVDLNRETEEETYQWNNETRRSEKVIKRAPGYARYKAVVTNGEGGRATGTKSEKAASFGDYIEKAETGAIGRALAGLGFGTQFTGDEFDEQHRIVDAPVNRDQAERPANSNNQPAAPTRQPARASQPTQPPAPAQENDPQGPATDQQRASLVKLYHHLGKAEPEQQPANYLAAKELIAQLSQEYRQSRQK
jgi:hypothetical protein